MRGKPGSGAIGQFYRASDRTRAHQFADAALFPRPACPGCASLTRATWSGNEKAPAGRGLRDARLRSLSDAVRRKTGRASCRERVFQYVYIAVGAVSLKK